MLALRSCPLLSTSVNSVNTHSKPLEQAKFSKKAARLSYGTRSRVARLNGMPSRTSWSSSSM